MVNYKTLTLEELKKDYSTRHGFVFKSPIRSSDKAIENLCNTLVHHKITNEMPEFVVRLSDSITAFVYVGDSFDAPLFFHSATIAMQIGVAEIHALCKL